MISIEQISRVGDSTVSTALRRLPGVTLVGDQFIYIRGLGERYSSTTVNGAYVPSPDLTRNVIPMDLFPSEIVESLSIQKGYSADQPAAFGGGNVDIRTRTIPDDFEFNVQFGIGTNSENSDDGIDYPGGSDDELGTDDGTRAMPRGDPGRHPDLPRQPEPEQHPEHAADGWASSTRWKRRSRSTASSQRACIATSISAASRSTRTRRSNSRPATAGTSAGPSSGSSA